MASPDEFLVPLPLPEDDEPQVPRPNSQEFDFLAKFQQPAKRNKTLPADEEQVLAKLKDTLRVRVPLTPGLDER